MSVLIDNRQKMVEVDEKLEGFIEKVVKSVLEHEGHENVYEVSISFVTNEEIADLNKEYRNIDSPTDVLSFPMMEFEEDTEEEVEEDGEEEEYEYFEEELPLGDIVISMEMAESQAEEYGHSFERELGFLLVHGMLHLLGFDHESERDEKLMFDRQEKVLEILNINR